jgi:hypothetical protein
MTEKEWMDYTLSRVAIDSEAGKVFLVKSKRSELIGREVGVGQKVARYKSIHVSKDKKKKRIRLHRLIYYYNYGTLPEVVDHIDGDTKNNSIFNLREATVQQNARNTKRRGIYYVKNKKLWRVRIMADGKSIHIGYFKTEEEALEARAEAEVKYFGPFSRKNINTLAQNNSNLTFCP